MKRSVERFDTRNESTQTGERGKVNIGGKTTSIRRTLYFAGFYEAVERNSSGGGVGGDLH